MRVLIIGGTGTISTAVVREGLAQGHELTVLNRGRSNGRTVPQRCELIHGDINDEAAMEELLAGRHWDVVCQFVAYEPEQVERDIRLFEGRTDQYIFISSASAYRKPMTNHVITESTPLGNPYWPYSQAKQACEERLQQARLERGFPMTIVRPSHTYSERSIPVPIHGQRGSYQILARMLEGKPIIVHGDGESLWCLTWNQDFAVGFVGLWGHPRALGEAVHITSDESISWNEALFAIGRALGVKPTLCHVSTPMLMAFDPGLEGPLLGDKSPSVRFDNAKIKSLVPQFVAKTRFDEGVRHCWRYISAHEELHIADPDFDRWCDEVAAAVAAFGPKN